LIQAILNVFFQRWQSFRLSWHRFAVVPPWTWSCRPKSSAIHAICELKQDPFQRTLVRRGLRARYLMALARTGREVNA
jgi:hypothetical protein